MHDEATGRRFGWFSRRAFGLVAGVLVANLVLDFLLLELMAIVNAGSAAPGWSWSMYEGPCTEAFVLATFFAQLVMLAIWTTLFPGSGPLRLLFATLVTSAAAFLFTAQTEALALQGLFVRGPRSPIDKWHVVTSSLYTMAVFLLMLYLVQIPFWLLRRAAQLQIIHDPSGQQAPPAQGPLRLIDLFAAMSIVAVPLALGRITATVENISHLLVSVLALSVLMIAFGLPYLWAILGSRRLSVGITVALLLSVGVTVAGTATFLLLEPRVTARDMPVIAAAFQAVGVATLAMTLANGLAARTLGYRLVWSLPWSKAAPSAAGLSTDAITSAQPAATSARP